MDSSFNARYSPIYLLIAFILSVSLILSFAIVQKNQNLIFMISSLFLVFMILRSNIIPIFIIMVVVSYAEWAVEFEYLSAQIMWVPELLSILFFVKVLANKIAKKQKIQLFGAKLVLIFLILVSVSMLYNNTHILSALLFLRLLFRYYFLFLAILNLELSDQSMKLVLKIFIFIFLSQLPISVVKLVKFGMGETSLGLSSHSIPTTFPMIAIAFLMSFYFLYEKKKMYIFLIFGFIGFSIIGGKRAFIFFLPMLIIFLSFYFKSDFKFIFRYMALSLIVLAISVYFAARIIPTLNPQHVIWGEFDLSYVINYGLKYTTHTDKTGFATGRTSSTVFAFKALLGRGLPGLSLGYGPGCILKSMFEAYDRRQDLRFRFGVEYGENGLVWLGLQIGYLGTFLFLLLFYFILKKSSQALKGEDPYWRALGLGMVGFSFIMMFMGLFYDPIYINDAISCFYFCLAGLFLGRQETKQVQHSFQ